MNCALLQVGSALASVRPCTHGNMFLSHHTATVFWGHFLNNGSQMGKI